jgi:hypothetical protein
MIAFPPLPAPFDTTAPTLVDPSGTLRVWLTDPPGMLDQMAIGCPVTTEVAHWLVHVAGGAMVAAYAPDARYTFLHEWRGVTTYTTEARLGIINWGRGLGLKRVERIDIVLAQDAGTLFRMAVQGGAMTMSVLGVKCALVDDVDATINATNLRPLAK